MITSTALQLRDPLTNRRLDKAVNIVPCCCKVNEESVQNVQFAVIGKFYKAPDNTPCPVCKDRMDGIYKDPWTRKFTEQVYQMIAKDRIGGIPPETPLPWTGPIPDYPQGVRGVFARDKRGKDETRMNYRSQTTESPLQRINFVFRSNERYFQITYKENTGFENFLIARGVQLSDVNKLNCWVEFDEPQQMRQIFELIVANNDFPAEVEVIRAELHKTDVRMPEIPMHI